MKFLKKILLTGVSRAMTAAGTFGLNIVLARQLSVGDYGVISVCLVAVLSLAIVARLGFETALLRFGGAAWHANDFGLYHRFSKSALLTVIASSCVITAVLEIVFALFPIPWSSAELFRIVVLALPFITISTVVGASFKAAHHPETGALFEVGGVSLLACGFVMGAVWLGQVITVTYAGILFVIASATFCLVGFLLLQWLWISGRRDFATKAKEESGTPELNPDVESPESDSRDAPVSYRTYFTTSLDFAAVAITQFLGNWSGLFFLEFFHGDAAAGLFSAARRTSLMPLLLVSVVVTIFSPKLAGLFHAGDLTKFKSLVHRSSLIICMINLPVLLIIAFGAPWIMSVFGKPAYQSHWALLSIMALGQIAGAVTGIAAGVLGMTGHQQTLRRITIGCALVSVLIAAILTFFFGVVGAAVGGAVYAASQSLTVAWAVRNKIGYLPLPALH